MTPLDTAVIVICSDQGRTLEATLACFTPRPPVLRELFVVDAGSTDVFTRQVLDRCSATCSVVHSPTPAVGDAWNLGVRTTAAPLAVIVPGNVALDPAYVEEAARFLAEHPEVSFVSPETRRRRIGDSVQLVELLAGAKAPSWSMFRRDLWTRVGGFSDTAATPWRDFCAAALECGAEGRWLSRTETARYLSRPRPPATSAAHVDDMAQLYRRHPTAVSEHGTALLLEKERMLLDAREQQESLNVQRHELANELQRLQRTIEEMLPALAAAGRSRIDLGDFATTMPISPVWGLDRGIPLDRYYISAFLERHRRDVRGRVLEVKDAGYTRAYGDGRVTSSDVIDIDPDNPDATIRADLTSAACIGDNSYDCFVLTQTLGVIYDVRAALATAYRVLKPGGVLLCTVPASGRISYEGPALDGDFWRFTEASTRKLFAEHFPLDAFEIVGFGNVLACAAFLYGLAPHEIAKADLDAHDPFFPVVYGIRAVKPRRGEVSGNSPSGRG